MTTEPESDAAKGRRLVRDLFAAKAAVVDAANAGGVDGTREADAHFDQCESALADWEAETATPDPSDARLREIERKAKVYFLAKAIADAAWSPGGKDADREMTANAAIVAEEELRKAVE